MIWLLLGFIYNLFLYWSFRQLQNIIDYNPLNLLTDEYDLNKKAVYFEFLVQLNFLVILNRKV